MKIAIIQDFLRSGGTERQSVLLANAFADAGHAVTLITFRPGGKLAATVSPAITRCALQPIDLGLDWFAPGLSRKLRRLAPEVILCMGRMANCFSGSLQKKFPQAIVVATMRTGKPLPRRFAQSLHVVRHIVANSRDARNTLFQGYSAELGKISIIHNSLVFPAEPVRTPGFAAERETLRLQQGAAPKTLVLVCVAMFRPEKNQRELIEIAAGLPPETEWQLWLAGDGPSRPDCERLAAARGVGSRVKFLGFHADPKPLYRAADVAVHASWSEALSNFLIEAQAHGLPCVAYETQGMEECFIPNETGWAIERDNRKAFRDAVLRLSHLVSSQRIELGRDARDFARNYFDPRRQATAYLDLFRRLGRTDAERGLVAPSPA